MQPVSVRNKIRDAEIYRREIKKPVDIDKKPEKKNHDQDDHDSDSMAPTVAQPIMSVYNAKHQLRCKPNALANSTPDPIKRRIEEDDIKQTMELSLRVERYVRAKKPKLPVTLEPSRVISNVSVDSECRPVQPNPRPPLWEDELGEIRKPNLPLNETPMFSSHDNSRCIGELQTSPTPTKKHDGMQWVERYRPKTSSDVFGNVKHVQAFKQWVHARKLGKPDVPLVTLLYGPPGVGKTSTAHAVLQEEGFKVYEINASLVRTSNAIQQELLDVVSRVTLEGRTGVVLDEIDGGYSKSSTTEKNAGGNNKSSTPEEHAGDQGAVHGVIKFLEWAKAQHKDTRNWAPIVCIANEASSKSMQLLARTVPTYPFYKPYPQYLSQVMHRIIRNERITIAEGDKAKLIKAAGGDIRRLIYLMESYVAAGQCLAPTAEGLPTAVQVNQFLKSSTKDDFDGIFGAVKQILFHPQCTRSQAVNLLQSDASIMMLMVQENIGSLFQSKWPPGQSKPFAPACAHGKPRTTTCDKCDAQHKCLDDLVSLTHDLSFVDCIGSVLPLYEESQEDGRNLCAELVVDSVHYNRRTRHLGVEDPNIKFTSFLTHRTDTAQKLARLHGLHDALCESTLKNYASQLKQDKEEEKDKDNNTPTKRLPFSFASFSFIWNYVDALKLYDKSSDPSGPNPMIIEYNIAPSQWKDLDAKPEPLVGNPNLRPNSKDSNHRSQQRNTTPPSKHNGLSSSYRNAYPSHKSTYHTNFTKSTKPTKPNSYAKQNSKK